MGRVPWNVERIARWWTSAPQEARYALLQRAINGEATAPTLEEVRLAAILAEFEAREIAEG